ncbi:iron donor protein CyaY [Magnetovibrio blakemorei]|uniref:Iron-sulfur cluster assembly protein CyaY n=1 Tax=Magnetovibrio blakemorei TaxID=28181 RepID=A0A1E5QA70_9PROT|nr:iron donor protein CyaY [Magnetovibrio blakemorei]OEJ68688.1 iron donor protein CyaY [Magnetovibrio blakemorei]
MDASAFEELAAKTLESLFEAIDDAIGDDADVDFDNGILTVELEDGRAYVVNKHAPNLQIWLSSPISGAAHFAFDEAIGAWLSTRGGETLMEVLNTEFSQIAGEQVSLS